MNIFGIGLPEMILIFVVALLIFGPKKLPEIGRTLGKTLRSFQDASKEFEAEFKKEAERMKETFEETTATLERKDPPQLEQSPEGNTVSNVAVETANPGHEPIMTDTATTSPIETASGNSGAEGETVNPAIETSAENNV